MASESYLTLKQAKAAMEYYFRKTDCTYTLREFNDEEEVPQAVDAVQVDVQLFSSFQSEMTLLTFVLVDTHADGKGGRNLLKAFIRTRSADKFFIRDEKDLRKFLDGVLSAVLVSMDPAKAARVEDAYTAILRVVELLEKLTENKNVLWGITP